MELEKWTSLIVLASLADMFNDFIPMNANDSVRLSRENYQQLCVVRIATGSSRKFFQLAGSRASIHVRQRHSLCDFLCFSIQQL